MSRPFPVSSLSFSSGEERSGPSGEVVARVHELFMAHYSGLCRFASRCVHSRAVAEELVQDVFLKIWRQEQGQARAQVGPTPSPLTKAYLYQAVRNHALDYLKHERVEHAWSARVRREPLALERAAGVECDCQGEDLARAVQRAVAQLPERCRLVFLLRREQHLSYEEIAAALGISVKTVDNQMGRALRALKLKLASYLSIAALVVASIDRFRSGA